MDVFASVSATQLECYSEESLAVSTCKVVGKQDARRQRSVCVVVSRPVNSFLFFGEPLFPPYFYRAKLRSFPLTYSWLDFCLQPKLCVLTLVFGFKRHHPHMSALVNFALQLDCSDFNFDSQLVLKFSL